MGTIGCVQLHPIFSPAEYLECRLHKKIIDQHRGYLPAYHCRLRLNNRQISIHDMCIDHGIALDQQSETRFAAEKPRIQRQFILTFANRLNRRSGGYRTENRE